MAITRTMEAAAAATRAKSTTNNSGHARSGKPATATSVTSRTNLLDLPPELRVIIFTFYFNSLEPNVRAAEVMAKIYTEKSPGERFHDFIQQRTPTVRIDLTQRLALLATSKLMRSEAFDVYRKVLREKKEWHQKASERDEWEDGEPTGVLMGRVKEELGRAEKMRIKIGGEEGQEEEPEGWGSCEGDVGGEL